MDSGASQVKTPEKYGPYCELFFFFMKKEQVVASNGVVPNPCVSAETLEACALIGLHLLAADYEKVGSSGSQSIDPRDTWKHGCPKSMGTTTSAGPLKSLGRIGPVKW